MLAARLIFRGFPGLILLAALPVLAQVPAGVTGAVAPASSTVAAIDGLQPALNQLAAALPKLDIAHWKASKGLRNSTQQDAASIERDLTAILPGLLEAAKSSNGALGPTFAVYRNVDALYDVLLRIAAVADLAGRSEDAQNLERARASLEASRSRMGNALLEAANAQDAELARLRAAPAAAAAQPQPNSIVVDDGPVRNTRKKRSK